MKSRLTLIFAALVILLGAMIWVIEDRPAAGTLPALAAAPPVLITVDPTPPRIEAPALVPTTVPTAAIALPIKSSPVVRVNASGEVEYVARGGDTVSQLAIALMGSDSKEHRDAVIAANSSLQSNPDRVLDGKIYSMSRSSATHAVANAADDAASVDPAVEKKTTAAPADVAEGPKLKYIAQVGDTVGALAAALLGGNTKPNRDQIIGGNISLQQDPDHIEAGKTYTIVAPDGLTADPDASHAKIPTTQPDADELARLSVGRTLRYMALPGDTVSKLAVALLGSDTPANRDLIIRSNPSLKADPDHLVAGRTYWIEAPSAD